MELRSLNLYLQQRPRRKRKACWDRGFSVVAGGHRGD